MRRLKDKIRRRNKRKLSIRKKISGTAEKPRVTVYKSNKYCYIQVINDKKGETLAAASNIEKDNKKIKTDVIKTKEKFNNDKETLETKETSKTKESSENKETSETNEISEKNTEQYQAEKYLEHSSSSDEELVKAWCKEKFSPSEYTETIKLPAGVRSTCFHLFFSLVALNEHVLTCCWPSMN